MNLKILIDIGHPGHVHFFKNFIWEMEKKGHELLIILREREITQYLLDYYKIKYNKIGKNKKGIFKKILGIPEFNLKILKISKKFKPDVFLSIASLYSAQIGKMLKKKVIVFTDTEHAVISNSLTFPFSDIICTPSCFLKDLGSKQVRYNGYHELAYLHPDRFKPDSSVLKELNLTKKDKFFIVRFISWDAVHDIGYQKYSKDEKIKIIRELEKYGKVFITYEDTLPKELEKYKLNLAPEKFHDLLYYSQLYLGEGGTTSTEAAVLGIPSININPEAKYCGNYIELSKKYKLQILPNSFEEAREKAVEILEDKNSKKVWRKRREKMLKDKIDVTKWMVEFVEGVVENDKGKNV